MKTAKLSKLLVLSLLIILVVFNSTAMSQILWNTRNSGSSVSLDVLLPNMKSESYEFPTTGIFLQGRFEFTENVYIIGELPLVHSKINGYYTNETQTAIGNPYFGIAYDDKDFPACFDFGFRLPVSSKENYAAKNAGQFADLDRLGSFDPDFFTISGSGGVRYRDKNGLLIQAGTGPVFVGSNQEGVENDLFAQYFFNFGMDNEKVSFLAGLSGLMILTETDLDFGERTFHEMKMIFDIKLGQVQPGLIIQVPLDDDLRNVVSSVIGLRFGYFI